MLVFQPAEEIGSGARAMAASDSLTLTLHGTGGHGSRPETTVDPIVMAAATILRLQTIVSRETGGTETAVVTVGMVKAGTRTCFAARSRRSLIGDGVSATFTYCEVSTA